MIFLRYEIFLRINVASYVQTRPIYILSCFLNSRYISQSRAKQVFLTMTELYWLIEHGLTSAPTQYRLYDRRFFRGQKTQPTVSKYWRRKLQRKTTPKTQRKHKTHTCIDTQNSIQIKDTRINTASPLVYNNMGWLGDGSHRGQGC